MATAKEFLNEDELKQIAKRLNLTVEQVERLSLDDVRQRLDKEVTSESRELSNKIEANTENAEGTHDKTVQRNEEILLKLKKLSDAQWKESFQNTTNLSVVSLVDPHNRCLPALFTLVGTLAQQQETLYWLAKAYTAMTGKEPECVTYQNKEELPENLKEDLKNRAFPLSITHFEFENGEQYQNFYKNKLAPTKELSKILEKINPIEKVQEKETEQSFTPTLMLSSQSK